MLDLRMELSVPGELSSRKPLLCRAAGHECIHSRLQTLCSSCNVDEVGIVKCEVYFLISIRGIYISRLIANPLFLISLHIISHLVLQRSHLVFDNQKKISSSLLLPFRLFLFDFLWKKLRQSSKMQTKVFAAAVVAFALSSVEGAAIQPRTLTINGGSIVLPTVIFEPADFTSGAFQALQILQNNFAVTTYLVKDLTSAATGNVQDVRTYIDLLKNVLLMTYFIGFQSSPARDRPSYHKRCQHWQQR